MLNINQNFDLKAPVFNFDRDYFNSVEELNAYDTSNVPNHFVTNVAGMLYLFTDEKWLPMISTETDDDTHHYVNLGCTSAYLEIDTQNGVPSNLSLYGTSGQSVLSPTSLLISSDDTSSTIVTDSQIICGDDSFEVDIYGDEGRMEISDAQGRSTNYSTSGFFGQNKDNTTSYSLNLPSKNNSDVSLSLKSGLGNSTFIAGGGFSIDNTNGYGIFTDMGDGSINLSRTSEGFNLSNTICPSSISITDNDGNTSFTISCLDSTEGGVISGIKSLIAFANPSNTKVFATDGSIADLSTKANASDVATMLSEIETLRNKLSMLGDAYVGFARVSGDVDPAPSEEFIYGNRKLVLEIGSHMKLGTVKRVNNEAVLLHECAPGRITLASNGEAMAIDGSEGDLLVYTDIPLHVIRNEATVNNTNMSCIGVGKVPSYWQGKESKKFEPFAISPFYTVNAQLPNDERICAHCIINDTISGSHSAVNGFVKEVYKANGNGYPNLAISAIDAIQNALKKNANASTNYPYMGLYYEFYELWIMMMYIECGTLDVSDLNCMGVGVTLLDKVIEATWNTENISGNSGIKYFNADGSVNGYAGVFDLTFKKGTDGTALYNLLALIGKTYYVTTKCGEVLSLLDGITKAGLVGHINSKHSIFYRDENNNVVHATDNSINLDTGDGMEVNKLYFLVRNVPNCQGLSDGVMTAVVNMYVKLTCADDLYKNDTSMAGGYIIFKLSHSVYRGFSLPLDGMFDLLSGAYYTSGKQDGKLIHKFYYAKKWQDIAPLTDTTLYTTIDNLDNLNILRGLTGVTVPGSSGNIIYVDYSKSLFCFKDWGGNIHLYETAYTWNGGYMWGGGGTSDGLPEEGKACVKALAAGCIAVYSSASARSADCSNAVGSSHGSFAGAFAVPQLKLKQ